MSKINEYFEEIVTDTVSVDAETLITDAITYALEKSSDKNKANNIKAFVMNCDNISAYSLEEILAETNGDYNFAGEILDGYNQFNDAKNKITKTHSIATDISAIVDATGELQRMKASGEMSTDEYNTELIKLVDNIFSLAQEAPLADLYKSQLALGQAILADGADIIQKHLAQLEDADKLREAIERQDWDLVDQLMGYDDLQASQEQIAAYKKWCDYISQLYGIPNPFNDEDFQDMLAENQAQYDEYMNVYCDVKSGVPIDDVIDDIVENAKSKAGNASNQKVDPIIFDLDGNGFNVETKENGTNFDLDKNGFAERINWTKKDGFLCLDLNGNGNIDNGGELFGDNTLLADGTEAANLNKGFIFLPNFLLYLKI